jgi:RNA polymerase sigma-70 factor (ECF subfamily)
MTSNPEPRSDRRRAEFEATALPFMATLYAHARRLTRGAEDDAGDLVQEAYLRAYRTFDNFRPGTNCRAWLLTIMYSVFYNRHDQARRRGPTVSLDELDDRYRQYLESGDDAGEAAATADVGGVRMNPEVAQAVDQLPEEFRGALLLVDVAGLSYDEAAEVLACPVGTVRSRLYRARRLLFTTLADYASTVGFGRPKT